MARKKRDRTLPFLVVARTGSGPFPHPVEIALHPDGAASRMSFSLGPHAVNVGGQVALARVVDQETGLSPHFQLEFDAGDLHWLVPFLQRLMRGEDVAAEIRAAYVARSGQRPDVRWQARVAV